MPGAGDAYGSDPARAEQHLQCPGDLRQAWAAGCGIAQAGNFGWIGHVQVEVNIQRPAGQHGRVQAGDLAARM